jgi:hypothetical protein
MPDVWFWVEVLKRGVDVVTTHGAPYNSDEFVEAFSTASKRAIDLLGDIKEYTPAELDAGAKGVLRLIASVVTAYHRQARLTINANYMIPVAPTPERAARARFCTKDRRAGTFGCFLELKAWATDDCGFPRGLLLPVERLDEERSVDALLMGAPWALAHGKSYLVNDTLNLYEHMVSFENETVRRDVREYFDRHKNQVRSFISLPVVAPAGRENVCDWPAIAVVNIQSSRRRLMGWFPGNRRKLELTLAPLVQTFAHFMIRMYYDLLPFGSAASVTSVAVMR